MLRILLMTLIIFPAFSLDINKLSSKISKKYLEVHTTCYQILDINIRNPTNQKCDNNVPLVKRVKNTKNINRATLCHDLKLAFEVSTPDYCTITYCTPCIFREI